VPEARGSRGSPTVRRRELGTVLRTLRSERGMTVDQVAAELLCSPSKVSRMETGQRGATARDIRDLCDLYQVDVSVREHLNRLAAEGKEHGWWRSYDLDFRAYVEFEEAAVSLKHFATVTVMGLVQTAGYARAMHLGGFQDFTPERIEELVEVRMKRQQLLSRQPPLQLHIIFDEAVLRREVGGPAVMAEQLNRLIEVAKSQQIMIQVIPYSVGAHPAMESNFSIFEFDGSADVVYVEGLAGWLYLDRPGELNRYHEVFERLRKKALSPRESIELIAKIAALYNSAQDFTGDLSTS
jgi:transcriptional regulator with XRE-family HTH domain